MRLGHTEHTQRCANCMSLHTHTHTHTHTSAKSETLENDIDNRISVPIISSVICPFLNNSISIKINKYLNSQHFENNKILNFISVLNFEFVNFNNEIVEITVSKIY